MRLDEQRAARQATTTLRTQLHPRRLKTRVIEACVVAVLDGPQPGWGFCLRELPALH